MKRFFSYLSLAITSFLIGCSSTKEIVIRNYPARISNLGAIVNSSADDFSPSISANGSVLYFTSDREKPKGIGGQDFWRTTFDGSFWSAPENLGASVNTSSNEGSPSITSDGQTLYFAAGERSDGLGRYDIYAAELEGKNWMNVRNPGSPLNSKAWESQPSISSDGNVLYFVSDRKGGCGGLDIWKAEKGADGKWMTPAPLDSTINTPDDETSPYIASDGKTLYFSSNGHPGLGGSDMFVTRLVKNKWLAPVNLGTPLNSEENDEFYTLTAEGKVVYFASERTGGLGGYDLYRAEPNPFPPGAVVVVSGVVRDKKTKIPLGAALTLRDKNSRNKIADYKSNEYTGEYLIVFPAGVQYELTIDAPSYVPELDSFDLTMKEVYEEMHRDYFLRKDEAAPTLTASVNADVLTSDFSILRSRSIDAPCLTIEEIIYKESVPLLNYIFFEKGNASVPSRYTLLSSVDGDELNVSHREQETLSHYRNILNILGARLRKDPGISITLVGCNDNTDIEKGNPDLSKRRAEAVKKYFMDTWKIQPERISIEAMNLPINKSTGITEEGREENRRVEIHSSSPDLFMPVEIRDVQRLIKPPSVLFNLSIDARAGLSDWKFSITQKSKELRVSDGYSTYPDSIRWNWRDQSSALPVGESPLIFTLLAHDNLSAETKTAEQEIPVRFVTLEKKNAEHLPDKTVEKVSLILFDFDKTEVGETNRLILGKAALHLSERSTVILRGYTDASGEESYNLRLSEKRAETAAKVLRENIPHLTLRHDGVGESQLLFPNDTPEGRFYCRTVQVLIETPRE